MNIARRVFGIGLLAVTVLTGPASAQNLNGSCIKITGIMAVEPGSCALYDNGTGPIMITLQGSIDVITESMADWAIVSCWVCEAGSCGTNSVYGPSKTAWSLPLSSMRSTVDWQVLFRFSDEALADPSLPFPTFASYYCRLEVERTQNLGGASGPPTVPDPFAAHLHARTVQGQTLVVELQGTFPQPVSNRRQP